jgi:predicted N-formylglutamate amidohydrolase
MLQARDRSVTLLGQSDPDPVEVVNRGGSSAALLVCEHAGRSVPSALAGLGVAPEELVRHIGYDIGAEGLARRLSRALDATLVLQRYSRLVIDCNRPFEADDCVPEVSDGTTVPANCNLTEADRRIRFEEIHRPFHDEIAALLDQWKNEDRPTMLATIHSFTPSLANKNRPWQLGICFNRDGALAKSFMHTVQAANPTIIAAFNEPYPVEDISDYTIPVHAERRGLPHVLIEVRNDQLIDAEGQEYWARLIAEGLNKALGSLSKEHRHGA